MSGKKNMKSKQQTMVENSTESKVTTPVVEATPTVAETKQKGGRAKKAVAASAVAAPVVAAPVVAAPVVAAPVVAAPVVAAPAVAEKKQRGSRKKPEVQATAPVESKSSKARVSKANAPSDESKASSDDSNTVKPKVSRKKKTDTVVAAEAVSTAVDAHVEGDNEKHIRSFKVRLPGSETFEGRFTGLTPYQAANKALSKYFREGERTDNDVTFSICESTRKSKKSVYTYVGKRHKLEVPVKYSIQDGREIVKNFKNTLKKVKKSENQALAPPTDTSVSMGASA